MSNRIRQERAALKMSQEDLSNMLNITRVTLNKWESGKSEIPISKINTLCDLFGCSSDWLIGRSDYRKTA